MASVIPSHWLMLGIVPKLLPSLGPTLLICMGYIDPGKWAAAIDGGARFGSNIIPLLFALNGASVLCQYLSACIGIVTGKNLAQICKEEYSRLMCIFLGLQAEISAIILDMNMILGLAYSLNLLVGLDVFTCIFLSPIDSTLFSLVNSTLGRREAGGLLMSIAGFGLIFYLFGALVNQPVSPMVMNGFFPRLKGEDVYSIMSLLGAAIIPHGLYLQSNIVQLDQEQKLPHISISMSCYNHFLSILFTNSGIFLANYVMSLFGAVIFASSGSSTLTLQIGQAFRSPISSLLLFLVLFLSSQVVSLAWHVDGRDILSQLFGTEMPHWLHRIAVKVVASLLSLCCLRMAKAEGIYQILNFSQVVQAMLIPTSVIPLFRVACSGLIMGTFKVSGFVEILSLFTFLGMVATNLVFIVEILFGDHQLAWKLKWGTGNNSSFPFFVLALIATLSLVLTLWFAATPLKSASVDIQMKNWGLEKSGLDHHEGENHKQSAHIDTIEYQVAEKGIVESKSVVGQSNRAVQDFEFDLPESITDYDHGNYSVGEGKDMFSSLAVRQKSFSSNDVAPEVDANRGEFFNNVNRKMESESLEGVKNLNTKTHHGREEFDAWELKEALPGISEISPLPSEDTISLRNGSAKSDDIGSGSGSLSRLSGLGRAARRQLAAILDEFWGQLFDFHGQITQEARQQGLDVLLGLGQKALHVSSHDSVGFQKHHPKYGRQSMFMPNSMEYGTRQMLHSSMGLSNGAHRGPSSWSSRMQALDVYAQSSWNNSIDVSERRYSSLRLPIHCEEHDFQPATIHGHEIASYSSRIASDRSMDPLRNPANTSSNSACFSSDYTDQFMFGLKHNGSGSTVDLSDSTSLLNSIQADRLFSDNTAAFGGMNDMVSGAYPRKYHSLPDISGLALPFRASLVGKTTELSCPIGPEMPPVRSQNKQIGQRGPLAFDELSPSKVYDNIFYPSSSSHVDTRSLWSRQPPEQLFGIAGRSEACSVQISPSHLEAKLLLCFRQCIMRILKIEGSEWLFQQDGGSDVELIDLVAAWEKYEGSGLVDTRERAGMMADRNSFSGPACDKLMPGLPFGTSLPCCGDGCVWQIGLIVCFGVWSVHRILNMSLVESRPELWGKYTYVLNRLQGILDLAFFKHRPPLSPCLCLQIPSGHTNGTSLLVKNGLQSSGRVGSQDRCSASSLLELVKEVELAVSCRKGRTGTAAGDVAFPKGKENLASVLKRYKRRLSNKPVDKPVGTPESWSALRRTTMPSASYMP